MVRVSDWSPTSLIIPVPLPPFVSSGWSLSFSSSALLVLGGKVPERSVREPCSLDRWLPQGRMNPLPSLLSAHEGGVASRTAGRRRRLGFLCAMIALTQQLGDATAKSPGDVQTIRWTVATHLLWMRLLPSSLAGRDPPLRYLLWANQSGKCWW